MGELLSGHLDQDALTAIPGALQLFAADSTLIGAGFP